MSIWDGMKTKKEKELRQSYWSDTETIEQWMSEDCKLKEGSKGGYKKQIERFAGYLESKEITTATKKDAEGYLNLYAAMHGDGAAYNTMAVLAKYSRWLFRTHRVGEDAFLDLSLSFTYQSVQRERKLKKAEVKDADVYTLAEVAELLLKLSEYSKDDVMELLKGEKNV